MYIPFKYVLPTAWAKFVGMCATNVDDSLHAVGKEFSESCKSTEMQFTCKPQEWDSTNFLFLTISNHKDEFMIRQKAYISRLKPLHAYSHFSLFNLCMYCLSRLQIQDPTSPFMLPFSYRLPMIDFRAPKSTLSNK